MKHVIAPWRHAVEYANRNRSDIIYDGYNIAVAKLFKSDLDRVIANACLIAAAPNLLEACKMAQRALLNVYDPSKEYNHTYKIIVDVIKKAEGK